MKNISIKTVQRGAALVEFAILLPVFIFLVMGIIELGWALYVQNALGDAARLGTRLAVTDSTKTAISITSAITTYLQNANVDPGANLTVIFSPNNFSSQGRGVLISVTISMPYSAVSILPTTLFLTKTTLSASNTMAKEY